MNDVTFKILSNTRQQWLDFTTAKIGLQNHLKMTDIEWGNAMCKIGEEFIDMVWQRSDEEYRHKIKTDEGLGFWRKFRYEWEANDYNALWLPLCRKEIVIRDAETYIRYKKDFFTKNTQVRNNIIYRLENL